MQRLQFEPTWDKALSDKDRSLINLTHSETKARANNRIEFIRIREAFNHRGELLVMVLIHNSTKTAFRFQEEKLRYVEGSNLIAVHTYTLPSVISEPETSMPWTFIFPVESLRSKPVLENGSLEFVSIDSDYVNPI
ncbi:SLAP domain-containing protein [Oceanobacillus arenosus]|uniref:SLAP domain-containing protein n=1 Tax=Oceanobacillus arenosus TaxID=1229153 RepID=A0A3D8PQ19_9BACI|nr:SLAP domain-containing protein [Oceanobacillus arenosus]RDW17348.1 SLAP domain-containing protein [Oceanobacillus arenosus]